MERESQREHCMEAGVNSRHLLQHARLIWVTSTLRPQCVCVCVCGVRAHEHTENRRFVGKLLFTPTLLPAHILKKTGQKVEAALHKGPSFSSWSGMGRMGWPRVPTVVLACKVDMNGDEFWFELSS